jgi:transcriptional regulator with XRE-family HTH domain
VSGAGTGERIAVYRRRRWLSQAALAGLVGRSESWLSQVERGIRSVDRLSILLDMAEILHVDVESLIDAAVNADMVAKWERGVKGVSHATERCCVSCSA